MVLAHFSDGTLRDITRQAVFSTSNDAVAKVDGQGWVVGLARGEAAILARYLQHVETASLTLLEDVPGYRWPNPPENNYIDRLVFEKLRQMQIVPSELCSDEEFIRRVFLDVIGMLPNVAETQAFLASTSPGKRGELVAACSERPEYAEFWALKWADVLRLRNGRMTPSGVHKFHGWLVRAMRTGHALRSVRPVSADGGRQHVQQSAGQLLPGRGRHERLHRDHVAIVPGHPHSMRQVPQPSLRTLDAKRLLRHRRLSSSVSNARRSARKRW